MHIEHLNISQGHTPSYNIIYKDLQNLSKHARAEIPTASQMSAAKRKRNGLAICKKGVKQLEERHGNGPHHTE